MAKAASKNMQRVTIELFKDDDKYSAPLFVGLNDYAALIQRGVPVSVPYAVAKMLEESRAQDIKAMEYFSKARGNGEK